VVLVPLAVAITRALTQDWRPAARRRTAVELGSLGVAFLTLIGGYALAKGTVSEKLSLRYGAGLATRRPAVRTARPWMPPGLDDPRWDFSPKEETLAGENATRVRPTAPAAIAALITRWGEGLGGFFGLFAIWGAVRAGTVRTRLAGGLSGEAARPDAAAAPGLRCLVTIYLALYALAVVRHLAALGYLADRHVLPLVALSLPWAGAGLWICGRGIATRLSWSQGRARRIGAALVLVAIAAAIAVPQWRPEHHTRWGHWAAGRWLQEHASKSQAILDTRGWATFVADRPSYDYWHVRQALTDPYLAYVVVGADELSAPSRRAETLRAILAYSASAVAAFPDDKDGQSIGVLVYQYQRPESWEGLRP
jgi:hypothetical protein